MRLKSCVRTKVGHFGIVAGLSLNDSIFLGFSSTSSLVFPSRKDQNGSAIPVLTVRFPLPSHTASNLWVYWLFLMCLLSGSRSFPAVHRQIPNTTVAGSESYRSYRMTSNRGVDEFVHFCCCCCYCCWLLSFPHLTVVRVIAAGSVEQTFAYWRSSRRGTKFIDLLSAQAKVKTILRGDIGNHPSSSLASNVNIR